MGRGTLGLEGVRVKGGGGGLYFHTHTQLTLKAYRVLDGGRDLVEKVKLHSRP